MRAIIDGKRYDTDAALKVAAFSKGYDTRSFSYYEEGLYRTTRGAWFLAGRGNGLSPYARPFGDMWGPGERITPMSEQDARGWLEAHEEVDVLEVHFGDQVVDA